ncbi:MAG: hypothetical protein JO189_23700 [Deltaproteobacteria bacterium]|nr:hypothetical protein [Deltaproteobacteria bacterium]
MKDNLESAELMSPVVKRQGPHLVRRISCISGTQIPPCPKLPLIIEGDRHLSHAGGKGQYCQNAIDLAHAPGISRHKTGILSAIVVVCPSIPSNMDCGTNNRSLLRDPLYLGLRQT